MARPISNKPPKTHVSLSVSAETRVLMEYVAAHHQETISEAVSELVAREAAKIRRQTGKPYPVPQTEQVSVYDLLAAAPSDAAEH